MTKEFLEELGISEDAAQAVLEAAAAETAELREKNDALERRLEELRGELEELKRSAGIEEEIRRAGAKNVRAVKALLDMSAVTPDEEGAAAIREQLERIKAENGFLFAGEGAPRVVSASGGKANKGFGFRFTGVR